jgi:hypothetical protein
LILDPTALRFFLNLDKREDRRAVTEQQFESLGLPIQRERAIDGLNRRVRYNRWTHGGRRAVALSFVNMLRKARRTASPSVEIFEDDLQFHPNFVDELAKVQLPDDWDIFYFGGIHYKMPDEVDGTIVKAKMMVMNHAMIFRDRSYKRAIKAILTPFEKRFSCDKDLRLAFLQRELNVYAPKRNLIWQRPDKSDLTGGGANYFNPDGTQKNKMV